MAWCQEFGVQIHEGCDHLMAADFDRCSCADCGVICHGKFPGCATVWAAGPVAVSLRHPPRQLGAPLALPQVASGNGKSLAQPHAADPEIAALLQSLRSEVQALSVKVEGLQARAEIAEQTAHAATLTAIELPHQIGQALATALQKQHRSIEADLEGLRDQVVGDLEQLVTTLQPPSTTALQAAIAAHLDARLEWLVTELSQRLVLLGNEVVRINKHLATAAGDERPATKGATTFHARP